MAHKPVLMYTNSTGFFGLNHRLRLPAWRQALMACFMVMVSLQGMGASVSGSGTTLTITLDANDYLTIKSNGSTNNYTFTLQDGGTWTGSVSGTVISSNVLTVNSTALDTYSLFRIEDGGSGTSVTFDFEASPYGDSFEVILDAGATIVTFLGATEFTGSFGLNVTTDGRIQVGSDLGTSPLKTLNGNITLSANMQTTSSVFTEPAIYLIGSTIESTGTGVVNIKGRAGDGTESNKLNHHGINFSANSSIIGGTTGTTVVEGYGGQSTINGNDGILLIDGTIGTNGSDVFVKGVGGGTGASHYNLGISLSSGQITAGGSGSVTVVGTGGNGGYLSYGVQVGASSVITSSGGNVSVTGTGGSGSSGSGIFGNIGVFVRDGGQITSGPSGTVTVQGTGGTSIGNANHGVFVTASSSTITSGGGNVSVSGNGGGSSAVGSTSATNHGVFVSSTGAISAGTGGGVSVTGTGGTSPGNSSHGVVVDGTSSTITSAGGNVAVTGTAGGSGASASNYGLSVISSGTITAGSSGTVTIVGTGGNTSGDDNYGINVTGTITSNGGAVTVTGTGGGNTTSIRNKGVMVNSGTISSGSNGQVTVSGTGGNSTGVGKSWTVSTTDASRYRNNVGVALVGSGRIISAGGNVSVTGNGGGVSGTNSSSNGYNHGIQMESSSNIIAGGTGTTQVTGKGGSNSSGSSGSFNHGIVLFGSTSASKPYISSTGGTVTVVGTGGGDGGASEQNHGVYIYLNGYVTSAGSGQSVTVTGTGGESSNGNNFGVRLYGGNASNRAQIISSNGGNITVTAIRGNNTSVGLNMERFSWIAPNSAGTLDINTTSISMSDEPPVNPTDATRPQIGSGGGLITINASETGTISNALQMTSGIIDLSSSDASLTINANSATIGSTGYIKMKAGYTFILKPQTSGTAVNLHAAGSLNDMTASGPLNLSATVTDIARITGGTLQIGDANTGVVTVSTPVNMNAATSLRIVTASSSAGLSPTNTGTGSTADFVMPSGTTLTLSAPLNIRILGTTLNNESTGYRQLSVNGGTLSLSGATLNLSGTHTPVSGNSFTIVSATSLTGTFDGLPDGSIISFNGQNLMIRYTSTAVTLNFSRTLTWDGSTSTAWGIASNWTPEFVPGANDIVTIPSTATNMPALTSAVSLYNLTVPSGSIMSVAASQTLTVAGNLSVDGSINGSGTLTMAGTAAQTISGAGSVNNLTVNNSNGVSITSGTGNELQITGTLTPTAGTLTTNGNLRLRSTSTATARVGVRGTGSISGNVTVERYMEGSNRTYQWRLLGFPYSTKVALSSINGLAIDVNTNRSVMIFHEGSDDGQYTSGAARNGGYEVFDALTDEVPAYRGFAAWVYGSSGATATTGSLSAPLTISSTGALNESANSVGIPVTFSTGKGWNLISNPYASSINWNTVATTSGALVNIDASIYRWNPVTQTWVSFNGTTNTGTGMDAILESGAGFFVRTNAASPTLTISQSAKVTTNANSTNLFTAAPFRLDLRSEVARWQNSDRTGIRMWASGMGNPAPDEVYVDISRNDATAGFDTRYDAYSMGRTAGTGLSIADKSGIEYAMQFDASIIQAGREKRYYPLVVTTPKAGETRLTLIVEGNWDPSNTVSLIDKVENRTILLRGDTLKYSFQMDRLKEEGRFMLAVNHVPSFSEKETKLLLLGNPVFSEEINLLINHPNANPKRWMVTSMNGANAGEGGFQNRSGNVQHRIKVPGLLTPGMYLLRVEMDNGEIQTAKVMRQ